MLGTLTPALEKAFGVAQNAAARMVKRRLRMIRLLRKAYSTFSSNEAALKDVRQDLLLSYRLAKAWTRGDYRAIPWKSIVMITAGLIYFVNPVDLVPDTLAVIGFVDDIAVIKTVAGAVRKDLERFRAWETSHRIEP